MALAHLFEISIILIDIINYYHSKLLMYTEPPKGQVNWPPEMGIFASFLKIYFLTNFDIVVHSAYLVDALCGTPKYFDGASSLVWDLRAQYQNWRSPGTLCVYVYRVFCQKLCSVSFPQVWLRFYTLVHEKLETVDQYKECHKKKKRVLCKILSRNYHKMDEIILM